MHSRFFYSHSDIASIPFFFKRHVFNSNRFILVIRSKGGCVCCFVCFSSLLTPKKRRNRKAQYKFLLNSNFNFFMCILLSSSTLCLFFDRI